jgi:uncharacterized protein (TIGR04255 family)
MANKMKNAPIYYALAQVRFNTLASLATYVPAIQEGLRRAGYPDFRTVQMATLEMGGPVPNATVATRYLFLDAKLTSGFTLDQSFLTFQVTEYDTFAPFVSAFLDGLGVLHKEAALNYSERVGIRYLDAAIPRTGEAVSDYLRPNMLGLSNSFSDRELVHTVSETRTVRGKTTLVSRVVEVNQKEGSAALPEDLQPMVLKLNEKFSQISGRYAIIDTDSWIEDRKDFDLTNLKKTLDTLHIELGRSFELVVTPHALTVWD